MKKFLSFVENEFDTFFHMQLEDLGRNLSRNHLIEVDYSLLSYFEPYESKIYISRFWDKYADTDRKLGLKSDIFICALGEARYTNYTIVQDFKHRSRKVTHPKFLFQCFSLCEKLRVLEKALADRKGIKPIIAHRQAILRQHFSEQMKLHLEKGNISDALICALYCLFTNVDESPLLIDYGHLQPILSSIEYELMYVFEANNTEEIMTFCERLYYKIADHLDKDLTHSYFTLPFHTNRVDEPMSHDADSSSDKTLNNENTNDQESENLEDKKEQLPTWHRETSKPGEGILHFEIDQGTKLNYLGDSAQATESGDQAMGSVQGKSIQSKNKDYSIEHLDEAANQVVNSKKEFPLGKANQHAHLLDKKIEKPSLQEIESYRKRIQAIYLEKEKIKRTIQKTLESKKVAPRQELHWGRLDKKLLKIITEENPRLFYKKQNPSRKLDAVFSLLIDCSASMFDKMEETKKGVALFHEVLKELTIAHSVIGFWEEANEVRENYLPTYFQRVISYTNFLLPGTGCKIEQLAPKEDNRDGFAVRMIMRELLARPEKHKILFVFSDGSPSAESYDENGILDTYEAVSEARKQGITVIGIYLSNGEISDPEKETFQNIYGKHHIMVEQVQQLPEHLAPLLKKVILRTI